jgi:prophage regulatory protein
MGHNMKNTLLKLKDVLAVTGLSRSYVYALAQQGLFPKPVKLTERSSAWVAGEVEEWIESRIASRDGGVAA